MSISVRFLRIFLIITFFFTLNLVQLLAYDQHGFLKKMPLLLLSGQVTVDNSLAQEVKNITLLLLIPIVVAFAFFVFIFYRSRREALIKKNFAELEMKALRAQMNPHFMFNCLNSIRNFIELNDAGKASDYLVRFARLMRMVLENSNYKEVSLAKDMASLELYIQMEQMRFNHHFEYEIKIDSSIDPENTSIPPLILQPYVENAILHGLNSKKEKGKLLITVERSNEYTKYCIVDDGKKTDVSSKKPVTDFFNKTSMGSGLTNERIELLNKSKGLKGFVQTTDVADENNGYAGCKVEIMLPFEELN